MMFPKQIYVGYETDEDEEDFMVAVEGHELLAVPNGKREVAIYELVRVASLVNKSEVV